MKKTTIKNLLSNLYAGLISGGIFATTYFALNMGWPIALGFAAGGYVASIFLVLPSKKEKRRDELESALRSVLTEGEGKLKRMRTLSYKVKNQAIGLQINEMCLLGKQIFETAEQKPQYVGSVQQFSSYYLDTTIKIINKYIKLSKHKSHSQDIQQALQKVESTLNNTKRMFEKQLEQLLKDDVSALDAEMSVLEETLALEGLDSDYEE